MRDDGERLTDILEAIDRAQRYAVRGRLAFEQDELIQAWMVQQLMVIGEAASRLSRSVRERASDVPWRTVVGPPCWELLDEADLGPAGGQAR